jgi:predicted RNA-binding protein with PUA-like domain
MKYWLMKSEPDVYPWSKLVKDGTGNWDGVRNHTAKLNLMAMQVGDRAFFYHSNIGKEIVGVMEIAKTAHPDPTAEEGPWVQVTVKPVEAAKTPLTLADIKATPELAEMALLKYSRLSVQPVTPAEWKFICKKLGVKA